MRGSNKQVWLGAIIGLALAGTSTTAFAQAPAPGVVTGSDHDNVIGRFAIGYLGASQVAVGVDVDLGGGVSTDSATVLAPVVGMRYWFDQMVGLDVGIGFGVVDGETKVKPEGGESRTFDDPSYSAFILHAGVPLSLAQGKHFSFQVVPELNLGFGSGEAELEVPGAPEPLKVDHSGMRLDIGARAGAELHFGFIGVPELSLQGSVGVQFVMAKTKSEIDNQVKIERSQSRIGTTVGDNPWNIFTTNVAALYYF